MAEDDPVTALSVLEQRLNSIEKRFDDIKWYFGGVAAFFALAMTVFTLVSGWNFSNERTSLQQFKSDLRADLGKLDVPPKVELRAPDGLPLQGADVPASIKKLSDGNTQITLHYELANTGDNPSGTMYMKIYTSDHLLVHDSTSTDERSFKFEIYLNPKDNAIADLPGKYVTMNYLNLNADDVKPGRYPMALKIFYGKGLVTIANFVAVLGRQ